MADRKMADRKMADRKMKDRKMEDRKMEFPIFPHSIFLSSIFLSFIFLSASLFRYQNPHIPHIVACWPGDDCIAKGVEEIERIAILQALFR
jgi:hypothetical protein